VFGNIVEMNPGQQVVLVGIDELTNDVLKKDSARGSPCIPTFNQKDAIVSITDLFAGSCCCC
jgi:hypothetical protein